MADPVKFVVTDQSLVGTYGYFEPPDVCWENKQETSLLVTKEEIKKIVEERKPAVHEVKMDVNGDQIVDHFTLAETPDKFLVLLYRGAKISGSWENCGGGSYDENGFEGTPQLIGAFLKTPFKEGQKPFLEWSLDLGKNNPRATLSVKKEETDYFAHQRKEKRITLWESKLKPCPEKTEGTTTAEFEASGSGCLR